MRTPTEESSILALVVMSRTGVFTVPLPESGEVTIGRGDECEVRVDDVKASRRHATVRLGATIEVVDLGSRNGTLVGERRLAANEPIALAPGDMITIGSTVLVLRPTRVRAEPTRVWSQTAFEERVEREHARARADKTPFAIVHVRLLSRAGDRDASGTSSTTRTAELGNDIARADLLEVSLRQPLRAGDVVGSYPEDSYRLLLAETPTDEAERISEDVGVALREAGFRVEIGIACHPRDGDSQQALEASAKASLHSSADEASPPSEQLDGGVMARLAPLVERIASGTISALILGETGVGKEVMARAIHERSPRSAHPLVCINCAALSESLLESELFGHEKGAFTGALQAKQGLLESAEGGTVFLDELGEMPLSLQAKMLRVLEQREVLRVGSLRPRPIDVRFLAATNRDLELCIRAGTFREDLYFRLNGISLTILPLRERVDEIEPLARAFIVAACEQAKRRVPTIAPDALELLQRYRWPGNVRELRNAMERAVLLSTGDVITLEHLPVEKMGPMRPLQGSASASLPLRAAAPTLAPPPDSTSERERIIRALDRCAGNQTHAAKLLGISRRTLVSRLTEFDIPRPRKRD